MTMIRIALLLLTVLGYSLRSQAQNQPEFKPGALWYDDKGELINAHGGGILFSNKTYYWFGEKTGSICIRRRQCVFV